ncbi:MAG: GNAT family N-acetyltransferase [Burkholderiaceae bacterium]
MIEFATIQFNDDILSKYATLFSNCFPTTNKYSQVYLRWLYCNNPAGRAVGFDAWDGDKLAAHYVCIPVSASVGGQAVKVLLSLNTATHPAYQGRGLFTKLAEMTYVLGAEKGFDSIYGVANANSTPGFIRKLGFQLVEPLSARVGVGRLHIDFEFSNRAAQFERIWSPNCLDWRCSNPHNAIFQREQRGVAQFQAAAFGRLLPVYAELSSKVMVGVNNTSWRPLSPARLFLGLVPSGACKFNQYFDIPQRLRPSPLNFIYRSLSTHVPKLEKGVVSLSFLDFDAY